jgi:hypothetical protein
VEVFLQRFEIELLELLAVVEVLAHRIGLGVVLMQDVEVEGIRPPVHHRRAGVRIATVHHRAQLD